MINIIANGSKWAGSAPDSIETLLQVLAEYPLERILETDGGFHHDLAELGRPDILRFSGNFYTLSHVFQIETDEPALIDGLKTAIAENMARPDYLAQETWEQRKARELDEWQAKADAAFEKRQAEARATLGLIT